LYLHFPYLHFPSLQIRTWVFRTRVFHPCEIRCFVLAFSVLAFSSTCLFSAPDVHSTMTRSSRFHCLIGVINKLTTDRVVDITCIPTTCCGDVTDTDRHSVKSSQLKTLSFSNLYLTLILIPPKALRTSKNIQKYIQFAKLISYVRDSYRDIDSYVGLTILPSLPT